MTTFSLALSAEPAPGVRVSTSIPRAPGTWPLICAIQMASFVVDHGGGLAHPRRVYMGRSWLLETDSKSIKPSCSADPATVDGWPADLSAITHRTQRRLASTVCVMPIELGEALPPEGRDAC